MRPVLFRWGSHILYWYSALVYLGIVLAIAYVQWRGRRAGYRALQVLDGALWALAGGLVGARLAYVLPNWGDYAGRPVALLRFWGGGLVFQGGLIGGAAALWLYSLFVGLSFPRLADLAAPAVGLAQSFGWAGAWTYGANYGLIIRSVFSMWLPDLYGVYGPRFPTQFLACVLGLLSFLGLHRLSRLKPTPGILALLYLLSNGVGHFALEFTRADEAPFLGLLRLTQIAELVEIVIAAALLLYLWLRHRRGAKAREGSR
jgi:phosphatidylglycerol:prolipoprotein diacylglycerol transferase